MLAVAVALTVPSCGGGSHSRPRTRLSVKQIVEKSKPAIVRVEAAGDRVGTGFAIDPSGIIATNLHVVAGTNQIQVKLLDGTTHPVRRVIAFDPDRDLTLLALDLTSPMPSLALGDSDQVSAGDPVVAIGNPLGVLDYTVSDGLISWVRVISDQLTVLQISAPISQGSSGGPLFNPYGEVIGIATAIFTGGQNLNFAVPSKYLEPLLAGTSPLSLDEFAAATTPPEGATAAKPGGDVKIQRQVPVHDLAVLDGCSAEQLAAVAAAVTEAIEVGAPLYNAGNHAACYKIYEGTSMKQSTDAPCEGVRKAFREGLSRAGGLQDYTEKAWALRDTFDGLLDVIMRKVRAGG